MLFRSFPPIQTQSNLALPWLLQQRQGPRMWQKTDQPNPMATKFFVDPITKQIVDVDSRPKMSESQEGFWAGKEMSNQAFWDDYHSVGQYNNVKQNFITAYDVPDSPVTKIKTAFESRFGPNKGGEKQGTLGTIQFDFGDKDGTSVVHNGDTILLPELNEFTNIITQANSSINVDKGIKIDIGGVKGTLPTGETDRKSTRLNSSHT